MAIGIGDVSTRNREASAAGGPEGRSQGLPARIDLRRPFAAASSCVARAHACARTANGNACCDGPSMPLAVTQKALHRRLGGGRERLMKRSLKKKDWRLKVSEKGPIDGWVEKIVERS